MRSMQTSWLPLTALIAAAVLSAACSDSTAGRVSLAFSTRPAPGPTPAAPAEGMGGAAALVLAQGDSTVVVRNNDTLVIRSVEVVVRDVELKRVEAADCPDLQPDDDGCEEFETGPVLVPLPLGNATEVTVTIAVPPAMYDELEFDIHKPDEIADAAFIAANPLFADRSIHVLGRFSDNGTSTEFTYFTDLNESQEMLLVPFLEVLEDAPGTTVTLRLDVSRWFLDAAGGLVNPSSANKNEPNENLVRDNIRNNIDAFRDDDHDGLDDDNEGS